MSSFFRRQSGLQVVSKHSLLLMACFVLQSCQAERVPGLRETIAPDSAALRDRFGRVFEGPNLDVIVSGADSISYWPATYHCAVDCDPHVANVQQIYVRLPRAAKTVRVEGFGPFICSGTLPLIKAYDIGGALLVSEVMEISDPPDCALGDDDMSGELEIALSHTSATIDYLTIDAPSPWTWFVPGPAGTTIPARAKVGYFVTILEPTSPPTGLLPICPPDGDPVWDSLSVRAALDSLFQLSGALSKPDSLRLEWPLLLYRNADGSFRLHRPTIKPGSQNNCAASFSYADTLLGAADPQLLATLHVHPTRKNELTKCPGDKAVRYNNDDFGGFSSVDVTSALTSYYLIRQPQGLPPLGHYIMDGDRIWTMRPGTDPASYFNNPTPPKPRVPTNCRWY